jgi:ribosome modulation factor
MTIEWPKGNHAGFSWMKDPRQRGLKAGQLLLAPSSCPYADGSPEAHKWEKGWREGTLRAIKKTGRPL